MIKKIKNFLLVFFTVTCIGSIIYIIDYQYYQYKVNLEEKNIEELKQKSLKNPEDTDVVQKQQSEETSEEEINKNEEVQKEKKILPQYEELYQENSDLIGWITIDDTPIDYPVMQTIEDPTYYIHRDWNKNESNSGLPLIDARCTLESENIIIYSHNMKNGTMFGSLKKYKDKSYYDEHTIINFNTIFEETQYQIVSVLLAKVYYYEEPPQDEFLYYNYIELNSEEEFKQYIDNVKELSLYDTGETAKYGDRLITLCTCDYYTEDGRLLIVAKKIQ